MNRLRVKALIGLANIYLSIAFMLLRWARIYVRNTAYEDGLKFSTRQCGKNYRALLILVNHEPRIDSEHDQFVKVASSLSQNTTANKPSGDQMLRPSDNAIVLTQGVTIIALEVLEEGELQSPEPLSERWFELIEIEDALEQDELNHLNEITQD